MREKERERERESRRPDNRACGAGPCAGVLVGTGMAKRHTSLAVHAPDTESKVIYWEVVAPLLRHATTIKQICLLSAE